MENLITWCKRQSPEAQHQQQSNSDFHQVRTDFSWRSTTDRPRRGRPQVRRRKMRLIKVITQKERQEGENLQKKKILSKTRTDSLVTDQILCNVFLRRLTCIQHTLIILEDCCVVCMKGELKTGRCDGSEEQKGTVLLLHNPG